MQKALIGVRGTGRNSKEGIRAFIWYNNTKQNYEDGEVGDGHTKELQNIVSLVYMIPEDSEVISREK